MTAGLLHTEFPKTPGYYWIRAKPGEDPVPGGVLSIEVTKNNEALLFGTDLVASPEDLAGVVFWGPFLPPDEFTTHFNPCPSDQQQPT